MTVLGIRHHGPGCARQLRAALEELQPDAVIIEAPADVASVLPLAASSDLHPPVAMLVYPQDKPSRSTVYPLAIFSPEWQAITWALSRNVPLYPMDLPLSHRLALDDQLHEKMQAEAAADGEEVADREEQPAWRTDPLALLAEAAGYHDHELWWEELIERRQDATGLFSAILAAMQAVRDECPEINERDLLREAFMRKTIRGVMKQGAQRIAIVCGAWHAPVLDDLAVSGKRNGCRIKEDNDRLRNLPKLKTIATWIPWTHGRLAYRSGYGAGVHSPGWYAHLWQSSVDAPTRWIVDAARLLRKQDLGASSASLIETRRLADALASLRDRRAPGLQELNEAIQTVLCQGEAGPLHLIRKRLELGDLLGSVPSETPAVPLDRDLKRLQTSLRMKPSTQAKILDLDLRTDNGRERSWLLHQLRLLGISWGTRTGEKSDLSTFHEIWNLVWEPEFAINIIEASVWGNTVVEASTAKTIDLAGKSFLLTELCQLLDEALLANLPAAAAVVIQRIQVTAAVATDVLHLMQALPPLAQIFRYGDVRKTETQTLEPILVGIVERIANGLAAACSSVNDEAAEELVDAMSQVQAALTMIGRNDLIDDWHERLQRLADSQLNGLIRGWCLRCLLEQGLIDAKELDRMTRLALSHSVDRRQAAAWIAGLLRGSGLLLLHQDALWLVMDCWLTELDEAGFIETLPLLRRAFANFAPAERRQMSARLKRLQPGNISPAGKTEIELSPLHRPRAEMVIPILSQIIGGAK